MAIKTLLLQGAPLVWRKRQALENFVAICWIRPFQAIEVENSLKMTSFQDTGCIGESPNSRLLIMYGSQTGVAESIAKGLHEKLFSLTRLAASKNCHSGMQSIQKDWSKEWHI